MLRLEKKTRNKDCMKHRIVVKVGSNYYYTLEDAIAAATEGETVTLLASITSSAIITI